MQKITRWHLERPPSEYEMRAQLVGDGMQVLKRQEPPGKEFAALQQEHDITLYIIEGMLRVSLPDEPIEDYHDLMAGDRIDLTRGIKFGLMCGPAGAIFLEGKP